jgi:hypothetical protein
MEIQSAKYLLNDEGTEAWAVYVVHSSDSSSTIRIASDNPRYQEILRQVEAGELTIAEAE